MESLKALENIRREAGFPYFSTLYDIDMWREDFAIVEKHLKALEILMKKVVSTNGVQLLVKTEEIELTDEEKKILLEVLL